MISKLQLRGVLAAILAAGLASQAETAAAAVSGSFKQWHKVTLTVDGVNGSEGSFEVSPSDKTERDFRGLGRLQYEGGHYLRFASSGDISSRRVKLGTPPAASEQDWLVWVNRY